MNNVEKNATALTVAAPLGIVSPSLSHGLDHEAQRAIMKAIERGSTRIMPNFGGDVQVMVLIENNYTARKTETEATQEFIKDIRRVELERTDENMMPTGRKDASGREIFKVKTEEVVKGWKQIRSVGATIEQKTSVYYPYVFTVKDAKDWTHILGAALTLHKKNIDRQISEGRTDYKKTGQTHCYMIVGRETVSTKQANSEGIRSGLLTSDFKLFCKSIYGRLKTAIESRQSKVQAVDVNAMFQS